MYSDGNKHDGWTDNFGSKISGTQTTNSVICLLYTSLFTIKMVVQLI